MIRLMTSEDLPRVLEIEIACFTDPWSEQGFLDSLDEMSAYLVVNEDLSGKIVGYACLYVALDEGEIVNVAVDPKERQKGYGAELVRELLLKGKSLGAERFFLEVRKSNAAGRILYTRLGFAECGVRKGFYENPKEDAVLMLWPEAAISQ